MATSNLSQLVGPMCLSKGANWAETGLPGRTVLELESLIRGREAFLLDRPMFDQRLHAGLYTSSYNIECRDQRDASLALTMEASRAQR